MKKNLTFQNLSTHLHLVFLPGDPSLERRVFSAALGPGLLDRPRIDFRSICPAVPGRGAGAASVSVARPCGSEARVGVPGLGGGGAGLIGRGATAMRARIHSHAGRHGVAQCGRGRGHSDVLSVAGARAAGKAV